MKNIAGFLLLAVGLLAVTYPNVQLFLDDSLTHMQMSKKYFWFIFCGSCSALVGCEFIKSAANTGSKKD